MDDIYTNSRSESDNFFVSIASSTSEFSCKSKKIKSSNASKEKKEAFSVQFSSSRAS